MINIIIKKFIEYSKNYDLKNPNIMKKLHHSFRVMEYSKEIASSLNLNESDISLASIIGLLHDIARFEQWTNYETYSDSISIDHGDLGYDILKEFLEESIDKNIILTAVKNHNKFKIEDNLDEKTMLFCKIIRDADKLDILKEQGLVLTEQIDFITPQIMECFNKNKLICDSNTIESESNEIFRQLAFIYDLNFKYSYEFILKNDIIKNKINLLEIYSNELDKLEQIKKILINYINKKIN